MLYVLLSIVAALVTYWGAILWHEQRPAPPHIEQAVLGKVEVSPESFTLDSPAESIPAVVQSRSGTGTITKRGSDGPRPVSDDDAVVDGESFSTDPDAEAILSIPDLATVTLTGDTGITITQALRGSYLIALDGELTVAAKPSEMVSVRSQGVLVQIDDATATVRSRPEEARVVVSVETGQVTVTFLNAAFETEVFTIDAGQVGTVENAAFSLDEDAADDD